MEENTIETPDDQVVSEEPKTSMADAFEAALNAAKESEPDEIKQEAKVGKENEPEQEEASLDEDKDPEQEVKEADKEEAKAPNEWTEEEKELFEQAQEKEELKPFVDKMKDKYINLKKGFYKKAEELANEKKFSSQFKEIFEPYGETLKQHGHTPQSYVKSLVSWDSALAKDAPTAIKSLMEAYKVTPDKLGFSNEADDYYENNETTQLRLENERLKKQINGSSDSEKRNAANSAAEQIRDFKYSIDENGESKYPLFEDVKHEMQIILNAGKAQTLEEAYNASPTVKEKMLAVKSQEREQDDLEKARLKAAVAKKMARSTKASKTASSSGAATMDFRASLANSLQKASS